MIQIASVTPWSSPGPVSASFRRAYAIFVKIIVPGIRPGLVMATPLQHRLP
jgi:hypothetical protein